MLNGIDSSLTLKTPAYILVQPRIFEYKKFFFACCLFLIMIWESNFYSALGKLENANLQPATAPLSKLCYKLVIGSISITDMCSLELVSSAQLLAYRLSYIYILRLTLTLHILMTNHYTPTIDIFSQIPRCTAFNGTKPDEAGITWWGSLSLVRTFI